MFMWCDGELNFEQVAAVNEDNNVFLVACPGSGKTRTLSYKIASELSKIGAENKWVVAITYTNRAADEIHERIENLGVDASKLWIGTIHSFCLEWILKPYAIYHEALKHGFRVIDSYDTEQLLTEICRPYRNPNITYWDCSNHYYTTDGLVISCTANKRHGVQQVLDQYYEVLSENNQIDFELILSLAYELVLQQPMISKLLSSLFSYILVDEYQDTKEIQYVILASILKAGQGRVGAFVVGDPNQSIFGSLGGYPIDLEDFSAISGLGFTKMELSLNYRSSERLVDYFGNYNVHSTNIVSESAHKEYPSVISFDTETSREGLIEELIRLIRYNIEVVGISPNEVCVIAPWWIHLASVTRGLVSALPEYSFDGPGLVPFSRDIENFWYKLSKIVLTEASPHMYRRRLRWSGEVLLALGDAGVDVSNLSKRSLLRECNSIEIEEQDGLVYLKLFFSTLFVNLHIDFKVIPVLYEHYNAFFKSSNERVERLKKEGAKFIGEIDSFRKVFEDRRGITVSTIHGVKGAEYDSVIAYALLEGMVPHFSDPDPQDSANKLLYVLCSRARKNLHLIAEQGRLRGQWGEYQATTVLSECHFVYDNIP